MYSSLIKQLIAILLTEMPEYHAQAAQVEKTERAQRELLRALMNVPAAPALGRVSADAGCAAVRRA